MEKASAKFSNWIIAIIAAIVVLLVLALTEPKIGLTWDEPAYIAAAESYIGWYRELFSHPLKAFSQETIDFYWAANHEHPVVDKIWSGVIWKAAAPFFGDLFAHRLGNILLAAVLAGLMYYLIAEEYSPWVGALAVGILYSLPRFFFHAHLSALDVPAAVMYFAVVFVFWQTRENRNWQSTVGLGIVWGLAVGIKINAVFVMVSLFAWLVIFRRDTFLLGRLIVAGFTAFGVFVLSWPWLFPQFFGRLWDYILWITVDHWQIGQYYFGQFYMPPPWHFPFVMLTAVVPTVVLIFFIVGVIRGFRDKEKGSFIGLLALNVLLPLLALTTGKSMVYDNERLFIPAFIFVAALAAIGVEWLAKAVRDRFSLQPAVGSVAAVVLGAAVLLPQVISASGLYPHLLSYYSGTVGGLPGANKLQLETTYWCETYAESLDFINQEAQPADLIWVDPWSHDVMVTYQRIGLLRSDVNIAIPSPTESVYGSGASLVVGDFRDADFLVVQYRQTSLAYNGAAYPILISLRGLTPVVQIAYRGIPLLEVYQMEN